jgi:hypothetical protein
VSRFNRSDKVAMTAYAVLALGALVCTQLALLDFLRQDDNGGLSGFLGDTVANPAATFMTIDLSFVAVVGVVFMLVEGYRLGMRRLWIYVLLTVFVAISVALPTFLLMRHLRLAPPRQTG